jgi:hypothetical protein
MGGRRENRESMLFELILNVAYDEIASRVSEMWLQWEAQC